MSYAWVQSSNGAQVANAVSFTSESGDVYYIGRVKHKDSDKEELLPGRVSIVEKTIKLFADGREYDKSNNYEVLTAPNPQDITWEPYEVEVGEEYIDTRAIPVNVEQQLFIGRFMRGKYEILIHKKISHEVARAPTSDGFKDGLIRPGLYFVVTDDFTQPELRRI